MVEKILNNTTPYGKIWASHEGSLHSSTLKRSGMFQSLNHSFIRTLLENGNVVLGNVSQCHKKFYKGKLQLIDKIIILCRHK